jgi:hypothetical protein
LYEIDREKNTNFQTQTKYLGNSHEIKLSYFTDFTNNILPLGFPIGIKNRNFVEDLPMIIPGQFGFNCPSGFREEAF